MIVPLWKGRCHLRKLKGVGVDVVVVEIVINLASLATS